MSRWSRLKALCRIPTSSKMTEGEYQANIQGLNIVFGAVLGFVLAGAENLETIDFVLTLTLSAGVVVMILYLGSSPYPVFYGASAIAAVAVLPWLLETVARLPPLPKLQPTLAVWTVMVILIELMPREGRELAEEPEEAED